MADTCSAEVEMSEDQSTNSMSQSDVVVTQNECDNLPEEKPSPNHSVLESSATLDDLPSSNYSVNEEPLKEVKFNEDSIKEESVNKESFNEESVNEESFNEESVNEESVNEESVNEESFNEESVNEESLNEESVNEESFNEEPVNEESFNEESVNEESVTKEPVNKEPVTRTKNNTLQMIDVPLSWERPDVEKLLKIYTKDDPEIAESVTDVTFVMAVTNRRCFLTFTTQEIAKRAKMLLKKKKVMYNGKKIFVDFVRTSGLAAHERSRSRSPLGGMGIQNEIDKLKAFNKNERVLRLKKIPITWNKKEVEKYIRNLTSTDKMIGPNLKFIFMENLYGKFTGGALLRFANYEACKAARDILIKSFKAKGEKIGVEYETITKTSVIWGANDKPDFYQMKLLKETNAKIKEINKLKKMANFKSYQSESFQQKEQSNNAGNFNFLKTTSPEKVRSKLFKNDLVLAGNDPQETYGLSIEFLKSQGIQPPLWSKIFVGNLDAQYEDETKIRKLFGHAGMVTSVAIIGKIHDTLKLKVEYDHPVEAVQAVCMFNNQEVYNKRLVVHMDKTPNANKRFLPEGLQSFGPGLGLNGIPLKGVRSSVDLQLVKNTIMEEITKLRQEINQIHQGNNGSEKQPMQTTQSESGTNLPVNADPMAALTTALANAAQNNPLSALSSILNPQAVQMLQILSQPTAAHNLGSVLQSAQGQSFNNQAVAASTSGWNLQSQPTDVSQNMQTGYMNTQSGSNAANMQSTFMHGGLNMQVFTSMHSGQVLQDGSNMQGVANMQGWSNVHNVASMQSPAMQGGSNMQGVASMQDWSNVQDVASMHSPAMQVGSNMQGVASIQDWSNVQDVASMQSPAMQVGLAMQGRANMQVGPAKQSGATMQVGPGMQGGASFQGGPVMQDGASMHSRTIMQGGVNVQTGPNMPGGPNMQGGQNLPNGPNTQEGYNTQGGSNIQSGSNMHSGSSKTSNVSGSALNNNRGRQPKNLKTIETVYCDNSDRNRKTNDPSATVLFNYLPPSVTAAALHTKMREIGDAKQVEMTGPGRAVVVFYSLRDAEACIKLLDRTRVDGQTIDVRFL